MAWKVYFDLALWYACTIDILVMLKLGEFVHSGNK